MRARATRYRGERRTDATGGITAHVTVFPMGGVRGHSLALARSLKLRQHSPTGFEWGYSGSGPSQLALALLLDATDDHAVALRAYHWLMWEKVAGWLGDSWTITAGELFDLLDKWRAETERADQGEPIAPFVVAKGGGA